MQKMNRLLDIMAALRHPDTGCPWDIKQSFETIVPHTLEEAYEVADSIERGQMAELKDELGDLLFQVVFYAQMAKEQGLFEFSDIVDAINDKLVRRHPHVFGDENFTTEEQLNEAWEQSKASERDDKTSAEKASVLDGVALALPSLKRAQKLQKRAARVGFDWPSIEPVFEKINEEIEEVKVEINNNNKQAQTEEMGDLIFSCVNLSRHLDIDAEEALRHSNKKFEKRFAIVENKMAEQNKDMRCCDIEELENAWQVAKNSI